MFEKKFGLRIKKFSSTSKSYCVQYAHYRFIPVWYTLHHWLRIFGTWNPVLEKYEDAKTFARQFETIEDVKNWQAEQDRLAGKDYPEVEYLITP
jgi:hypothetical protein